MFDGIFVFLGVGMPDLDGGILHGLFGYEEFLKQYSSIHKKSNIRANSVCTQQHGWTHSWILVATRSADRR